MNPDVTYASCDAPQEKTDKEVELDEDGNEVRERLFFFRRQSFAVSLLSSPPPPKRPGHFHFYSLWRAVSDRH